MTLIRFMKERARKIVFNQDPGFKVVSYEQMELRDGVYMCRPIIKELGTGKFFKSSFQVGSNSFNKSRLRPYEKDEPVFEEIHYNPERTDKWYEIVKN